MEPGGQEKEYRKNRGKGENGTREVKNERRKARKKQRNTTTRVQKS